MDGYLCVCRVCMMMVWRSRAGERIQARWLDVCMVTTVKGGKGRRRVVLGANLGTLGCAAKRLD